MTTITPAASRRMLRDATRSLIAGAATTLLLGSLSAQANDDARLAEVAFHASSQYFAARLKVVSTNGGASWNKIVDGQQLGFGAHMKIDTKGYGYVERVGVFLGVCNGSGCGQNPQVYFNAPQVRDYKADPDVTFSASELARIGGGGLGGTYSDMVLARCNAGHSDASNPHTFTMKLDATMSANTRTQRGDIIPEVLAEDFDGGDVTRHGQFEIYVSCIATRKDTSEPKPDSDPHRTKITVNDLDLFLTTYATPKGSQSGPRGTQCDPLKVTTRIGTDKAGPVNVKLWRQVNGGPITSEAKRMQAEALGGAKFGDDWNKFEQFTKTTTVQYKAEILGGTFAPSTPWKSITIHCNGDFKSPTSDANPNSGVPPRGRPQADLPPTIVAPPPLCGSKAAKVRGWAPCIKTAQLPDAGKQAAEQKRKEAAAKRLAAKAAELRRREAALKSANVRRPEADLHRRHEMRRPHHFGRLAPLGGLRRGFGMRPQFMF
jgi:hypothetical protein